MALCVAAWLTVIKPAEAYPCTEYSGSGTETVHRHPIKDNCKLSYILIKDSIYGSPLNNIRKIKYERIVYSLDIF